MLHRHPLGVLAHEDPLVPPAFESTPLDATVLEYELKFVFMVLLPTNNPNSRYAFRYTFELTSGGTTCVRNVQGFEKVMKNSPVQSSLHKRSRKASMVLPWIQ